VGLGAIVVIGAAPEGFCAAARQGRSESVLAEPIECVEVLGLSTVERCIERFARTEVEDITVLVPRGYAPPVFAGSFDRVSTQLVADLPSATAQQLRAYSEKGIEHSFVLFANVYAETDLLDLFYFHREAQQAATRAVDRDGPLDLWVVDCAKAEISSLENLLTRSETAGASYFVRDYVCRLADPRDLRRLASEALGGRCAMRPAGREIRPGIWVADGAEIHRRARIVAPAFIGGSSKIEEDTLITRCSSIERDCCVDCGTVVENSSILANTDVGIWLDVCHAVVCGNRLMSLGHQVIVEISDPSIMRSNAAVRHGIRPRLDWSSQDQYAQPQIAAAKQPEPHPASEAWQLGANPIGGD
jgi:NDP-sugar pyrophosphorylase family protein